MSTATDENTPATEVDEGPLIHILWINAGLSCDGDSVALTAATQPSIEEIALGALPGLPRVAVHWPLIDFECGPNGGADDFLEWFFKADRGELEPFMLVVEGSIPNEQNKEEGYWGGFGTDRRPDSRFRPASGSIGSRPKLGGGRRRHLCHVRRHPRHGGQSDRRHGAGRLSRLGLAIEGRHPDRLRARLSRCSPTIFESLYLLNQAAGKAPMIPLDEQLRRHGCSANSSRGLRPRRLLRAGRFRHTSTARRSASSSSAAGGRWCSATSASAVGSTASAGARTSAASASAARCRVSPTSSCRSWMSRPAPCSRPRPSEITARRSARCGHSRQHR